MLNRFTVEFGVAGQPVNKANVARLALDFAPPKPKPAAKPPVSTKNPALSVEEIKEVVGGFFHTCTDDSIAAMASHAPATT